MLCVLTSAKCTAAKGVKPSQFINVPSYAMRASASTRKKENSPFSGDCSYFRGAYWAQFKGRNRRKTSIMYT